MRQCRSSTSPRRSSRRHEERRPRTRVCARPRRRRPLLRGRARCAGRRRHRHRRRPRRDRRARGARPGSARPSCSTTRATSPRTPTSTDASTRASWSAASPGRGPRAARGTLREITAHDGPPGGSRRPTPCGCCTAAARRPRRGAPLARRLFWRCSALAAMRPLALIVDNAQWADRQSLEALSYLARRIDELPVLIAIGARRRRPARRLGPAEPARRRTPAPSPSPAPLTAWGAVALIRRHAPDASLRACLDCHRAVDGSPWLLDELGRQIARFGPAHGGAVPPVTTDARDIVRRRLASLPPRDRSVARRDHHPRQLRATARRRRAGRRRDRRARPDPRHVRAAGLLATDGLRFVHGLVAAALVEDLTHTERERLHREAARMLAGTDASPERRRAPARVRPARRPRGHRATSSARPTTHGRRARRCSPPAISSGRFEERAPGDDRRATARRPRSRSRSTPGCPTPRRRLRDSCASPRTTRRGSTR